MVARLVRDEEVVGSNPAYPTKGAVPSVDGRGLVKKEPCYRAEGSQPQAAVSPAIAEFKNHNGLTA